MNRLRYLMCILLFLNVLIFGQIPDSIYDITVTDIDGNPHIMKEFQGKVLLIVNVASKCGFTPQYEGLETLYREYEDQGLVILGFPSNDFLWQEPGSDEEIKAFCTLNYGVTFPMFSKIRVKGRDQSPLYTYLTSRDTNPDYPGRITWNFNKFLVDREGRIVGRFDSSTEPLNPEIVGEIEKFL